MLNQYPKWAKTEHRDRKVAKDQAFKLEFTLGKYWHARGQRWKRDAIKGQSLQSSASCCGPANLSRISVVCEFIAHKEEPSLRATATPKIYFGAARPAGSSSRKRESLRPQTWSPRTLDWPQAPPRIFTRTPSCREVRYLCLHPCIITLRLLQLLLQASLVNYLEQDNSRLVI